MCLSSYRIFARPLRGHKFFWTAFTRPFSFYLWISILGMGFILSLMLYMFASIYYNFVPSTDEDKIVVAQCSRDSPWIICATFLQQGKHVLLSELVYLNVGCPKYYE